MNKLTKKQKAAVVEQVHSLLHLQAFSNYYSEEGGEFESYITGVTHLGIKEAEKKSIAKLDSMLTPLLGKIK